MPEIFAQIIDYLKNSQTLALPVSIASTIALSAPSQLITWLGFDGLAQNLKPYLGAALVLSMAVMIASACRWLATAAREWANQRRICRIRVSAIKKLGSDEIKILRSYVEKNTKTGHIDLTNGAIASLINAEILYKASDYALHSGEVAVNITPWAWDYLNEHKQVIGIHE